MKRALALGTTAFAAAVILLGPAFADPPVIESGPTASSTLLEIDELVDFRVTASDPDGDNLTYSWRYGDGGIGFGAFATYAYRNAGTFTVTVTVTDGLDPVSESVQVVVGAPLESPRFKAKLNFRKDGRDSLSLKAEIELPDGFKPVGKDLNLDSGGVTGEFPLDANGKAKTEQGRAKLRFRKSAGKWIFSVKMKRGSFAAALADEGMVNEDRKKAPVEIQHVVLIGTHAFILTTDHVYKAKAGKTGKAK